VHKWSRYGICSSSCSQESESTCAMQLQSMHMCRLQGRSLQGLSDDALLGGAIRSSQAAAAPILVHCCCMHVCKHSLSNLLCAVLKLICVLQHYCSTALCSDIPISPRIQCLTPEFQIDNLAWLVLVLCMPILTSYPSSLSPKEATSQAASTKTAVSTCYIQDDRCRSSRSL